MPEQPGYYQLVLSTGDAGKAIGDVVRVFVDDDGIGSSSRRVVGAAWLMAMGVFCQILPLAWIVTVTTTLWKVPRAAAE